MTNKTEKPSEELVGDLDTAQVTDEDAVNAMGDALATAARKG